MPRAAVEGVEVAAALLDDLEGLGQLAQGLDGGVGDAVGADVRGQGSVGHGGAVPGRSVDSMQLGVHYANFSHPDWEHRLAERLTETARVADQGGVAQFTVMDHWFQMEDLGGPPEPMLEGYTTLGYLAAVTERRPAEPARHRRRPTATPACSPRR